MATTPEQPKHLRSDKHLSELAAGLADADRAPSKTLTVRGMFLGLLALACALLAKHLPPQFADPAMQELIVELCLLAMGGGVLTSTYGMRRAIGAALLPLAIIGLCDGCCGPNLKPTVHEARITLEHLRADYERGRVVIEGARPETLQALRVARLAEIDAALRNLQVAEGEGAGK